jgi:Arc/MetJ-type ribon-helix-helix transcriptional regulator
MKRITVSIPDDVNERLKAESRRRDVPADELVRDALEAFLGRDQERRTLPFIALGRSGHHDTARNIDAILQEEWGADRDR